MTKLGNVPGITTEEEAKEREILEETRPETAMHEAGHVVASIHLGYPVEWTTSIPSDEADYAGHTEAPGWRWGYLNEANRPEVRNHAVIALAGTAAVAILKGEEEDIDVYYENLLADGSTDWNKFEECLLLTPDGMQNPYACFEEIWMEAVRILKSRWAKVEALASASLDKGRLEKADIDCIAI